VHGVGLAISMVGDGRGDLSAARVLETPEDRLRKSGGFSIRSGPRHAMERADVGA